MQENHRASSAHAWALRLPAGDVHAVAPLRLSEGIEIGEAEGALWLRGRKADEALAAKLRALPAAARYTWVTEGDRLRPVGALLAAERLPATEWRPLRTWWSVVLPPARLPAEPPRSGLTLVPSHAARVANAAVLPLAPWLDWMLTAPELRLARLRFAATPGGRCLVLGAPPPSLPCSACVEENGVVVPAGLAWQPAVSTKTLRRVLGAAEDAVIFWDAAGVHVLGAELFVPASRGAARATRAASTEVMLP